MAAFSPEGEYDPYEGVSEDPWATAPAVYRHDAHRWDDEDEPPPAAVAEQLALALAHELTEAGYTAVTAEHLAELFDQRDSIIDLDQTRYLTDPPHPVVVLDLPDAHEVLVVAVERTAPSRVEPEPPISWFVATWEFYSRWSRDPTRSGSSIGITGPASDSGAALPDPTDDRPTDDRFRPQTGPHGRNVERDERPTVWARGPWLELMDAAQYLGVDPDDLTYWEERGLISRRHLPDGRLRYSTEDLDDLLTVGELASTPLEEHQTTGDTTELELEQPIYEFDMFDLGTRNARVRTFTIDDCPATIQSYSYIDQHSIEVTLEVVRAQTSEAWVRAVEVGTSLRGLGRLLHGGRLGIRRWGHLETVELAQLQFTDFPWSGLRLVDQVELDEGAGVDVAGMLLAQGATRVGRRAELEACTNQRRNYLAAQFAPGDDEVPALAFVLTRIVPLIRAEIAMSDT